MSNVHAAPAAVHFTPKAESSTFVDPEGTGWYDRIPARAPVDDDIAEERDARELMPIGTDGDFLDEPTGPDDEDADWAARNLTGPDSYNVGWVEGEPDGSAIELVTVSAWDRLLDDLAADREAEARVEAGCACC